MEPGQTFSFYEILGPLGQGAMGEVYRARDMRLEREVALKVLPPELSADRERLQRFEREAKTLASISHPNIAHVYGIDQAGGVPFMTMELVPGVDLATRLSAGPLPVGEAIDVCRQIAEGVEAAHEAGVIHRDLKPANVVITPSGAAKVLDFGLAKRAAAAEPPGRPASLETEAGRLLGTPAYMAPEQARGRPVDRRVDVWAFGCVLYECLTGRRAFSGDSFIEVLESVVRDEPDLSRLPPNTPSTIRALLARCFDKDPRSRLRDVGEARVALSSGGTELVGAAPAAPVRSSRLRIAVPLLCGAALAAVAIALLRSEPAPAAAAAWPLDLPKPYRLTDFEGT